jgi:polyhydroxybutyrate depolymerase
MSWCGCKTAALVAAATAIWGCKSPSDGANASDAAEINAANGAPGTGTGAGNGSPTAAPGAPGAASAPGAAPGQPVSSVTGDNDPPPPARMPSSACGKPKKSLGFSPNQSIDVDGTKRTYDLFVPSSYDGTKGLAVVFVLHADTGITLRPYLNIEQVSAGKAIVVYPYGQPGWDLSAMAVNPDVAFMEKLRTSLEESYCIDTDRVFGFGYSQGGFLANMIACYRGPSVFKAIAVNSGGLYAPDGEEAKYDDNGNLVCPQAPVPALVIHGTHDNQVSYKDNGIGASNSWAAMNGCSDKTIPFSPDPCVEHSECASNPVVFCSVDMGHTLWSGAATAAWSFFSKL